MRCGHTLDVCAYECWNFVLTPVMHFKSQRHLYLRCYTIYWITLIIITDFDLVCFQVVSNVWSCFYSELSMRVKEHPTSATMGKKRNKTKQNDYHNTSDEDILKGKKTCKSERQCCRHGGRACPELTGFTQHSERNILYCPAQISPRLHFSNDGPISKHK